MKDVLYPPQKVTLNTKKMELEIVWRNGAQRCVSASELRRYCACSGCRSKDLVGMSLITDSSDMEAIHLIGNSALQIVFADGHDRGIYPWAFLNAIENGSAKDYLDEGRVNNG